MSSAWPLYAGSDVLPCSTCSLNIYSLWDNFVKKLVSEMRKCLQLWPPESSPLYAGAGVLPRSSCSLNIQSLCDNFVKKLVSEIRKCQLQEDFIPIPMTPWPGVYPWASLGALPLNPHCVISPPTPAEGLDAPLVGPELETWSDRQIPIQQNKYRMHGLLYI